MKNFNVGISVLVLRLRLSNAYSSYVELEGHGSVPCLNGDAQR